MSEPVFAQNNMCIGCFPGLKMKLTPAYEHSMRNQMFVPKGCMNEKTLNSCFSGFLIMMLIPVVINGFEKSTTRSRA